jgi:hypothetical protein
MIHNNRIRVQNEPWNRGVAIHILKDGYVDGVPTTTVVTGFETQTLEEYQVLPQSPLSLDIKEAQTLMDDLWNCGIRPSDGTGSTGQLKATENHLKDMQRLVFNKLED